MKWNSLFCLICFLGFWTVLPAQDQELKLRIVDLENQATVVDHPGSSSSTTDYDFPVFVNGEEVGMHFKDLYMILIRHDLKAAAPDLYMRVELIDMNDQSTMADIARYMRFTGRTEAGNFSMQVKDINVLEIVRKGY